MKEKIKELREMGYSYREIAKILSLPLSTVYRYANKKDEKTKKRGGRLLSYVSKIQSDRELRERLINLLLFTTDEKGRKRTIPFAKIYREMELHLQASGIKMKYHRFLQVVKAFINSEFGSIENLEKLRRPKEAHKYRITKGRVPRPAGLMEIDATGYTYNGVRYSLLFAFDPASGFLIKPLIVINKETGATHYNKAFSSFDVADYFIEIFNTFGVPEGVRCDNEKILNSRLIKEGLEKLNVELKPTRPYNPNHKLIERAIRTFKEELRVKQAVSKTEEFTELVDLAVEEYNHAAHSFIHTEGIPAELFIGYPNKLSKTLIENAFTIMEERTLKDNLIQLDGRKYELITPISKRKKKVLVKVSVRQFEEISVFDKETGEFIGVARLTEKAEQKTTAELIEEKRFKTKLKKREKKLSAELASLKRLQSPIELNELEETLSIDELETETVNEEVSRGDWLTLEDL